MSRDPIGDYAFLRKHLDGQRSAVSKYWREKSPLSGFVFTGNNPANVSDYLGLIELNIDSTCDKDGKQQKISDAWTNLKNLLVNADVPVEFINIVDCLKANPDKKVTMICGGCWCWIKCNISDTAQGVIGIDNSVCLCKSAFLGPAVPGAKYSLETVLATEAAKASCGLTVATEYQFADWIESLLGSQ